MGGDAAGTGTRGPKHPRCPHTRLRLCCIRAVCVTRLRRLRCNVQSVLSGLAALGDLVCNTEDVLRCCNPCKAQSQEHTPNTTAQQGQECGQPVHQLSHPEAP